MPQAGFTYYKNILVASKVSSWSAHIVSWLGWESGVTLEILGAVKREGLKRNVIYLFAEEVAERALVIEGRKEKLCFAPTVTENC